MFFRSFSRFYLVVRNRNTAKFHNSSCNLATASSESKKILTLKMTTAKVVETSVHNNKNSPTQVYNYFI